MGLTSWQREMRAYLKLCVEEVRSKKYRLTLSTELGYLSSIIEHIAWRLETDGEFSDSFGDIIVVIRKNPFHVER